MEPSLEHSSRRDGVAPDASPPTPLEQDPAVQPASDAVRYVEPGEDDNEEEQLFIETIRRGALAVQQRRRRLLEGPARSRSTSLQAAGVNESSNNADDYPAFRSSSAIVDSVAAGRLSSTSSGSESASTRLHSLISSSRLGAHLDTLRTSSGQIASRGADATGTSTATETEGPMMLLYCDSLPLDPSSPCLLLGLQPTSSSHATRVDITRTLASSYNTTSADARLQHDVPDLITAGGCGKLICARGFQNRKHGRHAFSSDTLPSHLLVDWLDVSLDEEGAFRCRSTCGCLYATLGCRNWYVQEPVSSNRTDLGC